MTLTAIDHFNGPDGGIVKPAPNWWGKPRFMALLRAMLRPVQTIEDTIWQVFTAYHIDTADTARLNILGKIVGQPRLTSDDEYYRAVIRAKIRTNRSRGLTVDLIEVCQMAAALTTQTPVAHYAPATCTVTLGQTIGDSKASGLRFLLPRARAAAVQLHLFRPMTAAPLLWGDAWGSSTDGSGDTFYSVERL